MKVGDLVRWRSVSTKKLLSGESSGIVIRVDDSHRQTILDVLFADGIVTRVWENHLDVVCEEAISND